MITVNFVRGYKRETLTGIDQFSVPVLEKLAEEKKIQLREFSFQGKQYGIVRLIKQYFILPFKLLTHPADITYFTDQTYAMHMLLPIKNKIIVCHDIVKADDLKNLRWIEKISYRGMRATFRWMKWSSKIIAVSMYTKQKVREDFNIPEDKIQVMYNGFDETIYRKKKVNKKKFFKSYGIQTEKKIVLHVGSEESRKNVDVLIKGLIPLKDKVFFIKIGKPSHPKNREKNLKLLRENGIDYKIIEGITNEEIVKFYNCSDVFVFPSSYEGFGRPPIEAMACGCPVITTHETSLKEVVGDAAYILKEITPKEVTTAITTMIGDEHVKKELRTKGEERAKRFYMKHTVNEMYQLFKESVAKI